MNLKASHSIILSSVQLYCISIFLPDIAGGHPLYAMGYFDKKMKSFREDSRIKKEGIQT